MGWYSDVRKQRNVVGIPLREIGVHEEHRQGQK